MIKTLRITGVAAVAFAGVVLASVLGQVSLLHVEGPGDEKMARILASAGAVDRFRELHADSEQANQDTTPPLVKQAEQFKDIIDPKAPTPVASDQESAPPVRPGLPVKPVPTSQTFALLGTAYSLSDPSSSFAYIRSVDNTCQWVACGSEIGHLVIKEVRESSIVCWDGSRESELAIEAVPDRASLLEGDGETPASVTSEMPQPVEVKAIRPASNRSPRLPGNRQVPPSVHAAPRLSTGEQRSLDDLASRLKDLHGASGEGPVADANRAATIDKLMSEFKSSRVGPEETRNLENLGNDPSTEKQRAREEQKREFIRRLNSGRPLKD
ncbi:MAG: hypothetical protein ABFE13_17325 [Phycisphaerales bacterium]